MKSGAKPGIQNVLTRKYGRIKESPTAGFKDGYRECVGRDHRNIAFKRLKDATARLGYSYSFITIIHSSYKYNL